VRLWIKNPLAIFANDAEGGLVVEATHIAELVGKGKTPDGIDAKFDASRHVVLPGLVNTHHHFYQTLTRAHPSAINKALFPWLVALYPIWARLKPSHLRVASQLALTELMLSGCTTAADHHYLYPEGLENAVDIEVEEARSLGMRMTVSRGSMNLSERDGGLPPDSVVQDEEMILADSERVLKLFHDPKPGAQIRVALAPCSPFSISKALMIESAKLAERYDCQLHTHLCETEDEEQFSSRCMA
jgi:8-oxoguanine deaminase